MVPRFTDFYIPVLQVMSDVEPIEINNLIEKVANHIQLSEEDRKVITEGGTQLKYRSNICWAVTDLFQGSFIERVKRGHYVITMNGLELLEEKPINVNREYLAKCSDDFRKFLERRGTRKKNITTSEIPKIKENRKLSLEEKEDYSYGRDKKENNSKKSELNESEASLEELYRAVETLKKANLSTVELENKINELKGNIVFNNLLESLSKIIPQAFCGINRRISLAVEYIPNETIQLKVENKLKIIQVREKYHNSTEQNGIGDSNGDVIIQSINKPVISSVKSSDSNNNRYVEKSKIVSSGVWIKNHSDRTIIIEGDTENFTDLFKSYGGIKISKTQEERGWIFMRNREEGLRNDLKEFLISEPNNNDLSEISIYKEKKIIAGQQNNKNTFQDVDIAKIDDTTKRYIEIFDKMRSFNFLGITGPHKAILLLAIYNGINTGKITENKIYYNEELESSYNDFWNKYIGGTPTLGAVYPYIHLGRECFFVHKLHKPIRDFDKTWSKHKVSQYVQYAILDKRLFDLLQQNTNFYIIKKYLITRYCINYAGVQAGFGSNKDIGKDFNSELKVDLIPEKSNNYNQLDVDKNLQESFKDFLSQTGSKNGNSYTTSTISVYLGALNSLYLINIVCKYHSSGNIFNIKDPITLDKIKNEVSQDCEEKVGSPLCRSALALYCKFIRKSKN